MTDATGAHRHTNRLASETSPYLLQHAHNPVDWYPWGPEALELSRKRDAPILLSIGYSACHWCHVMERESFEDEAIAKLMNESFVCVKVDREERPDLDEIYMAATVAMNSGQGGWPMTVFLTPEQEPFFAGTYFPPRDAYGRPGFPTLLSHIAQRWKADRASLVRQGKHMVDALREQSSGAPEVPIGAADIDRAVAQLARDFDPRYGGFGSAPKFPPSESLSLLLRHHRRTGDAKSLEMVTTTLRNMAHGGMYDQLAGGFARYSTDDRWLVPHFEKMLYDNAQLARVYVEAWQATGDPEWRRVATEVLEYVLREMTSPEGGFYSSTDADSEGEEGKFFVWTKREVEALLPEDDAALFCRYYDVADYGNWEGHSILNVTTPLPEVAKLQRMDESAARASLARSRKVLYEARQKRVKPGLDDKILTAWNGLMIAAFAEGHRAFREPRYLAAAERAATFLLGTLRRPDGRLLRTYRTGRAHIDAFLEDYAYLADGLLDLYEAGGPRRFLDEARALGTRILEDFGSAEGSFFNTAASSESLVVRSREGNDGACPSPNAVAAHALARLSFHFGKPELREASARALSAWGKNVARHPRAFARSLSAVDLLLEGPVELAIIDNAAGDAEALWEAAGRVFLPNRIVAHRLETFVDEDLQLLFGLNTVGGKPALYVCRDFTCRPPVTDAGAVAAALASATPAARRGSIAVRMPGRAAPVATARQVSRLAGGAVASLASTGLSASRIGFGCYRIDEAAPEHAEALRHALLSGINLVDTSTNYGNGGSERLVGRVVRELHRDGRVPRDGVVVVSKIGYVQGENLDIARERERERRPVDEMVKYMEDCWHCIHPDWLADQLSRSLDRLGLETLDVCLLHNPEYFLSDAKARGDRKIERVRDEFYRRLAEAFRFLESCVEQRSIGCYGVSSNTCVSPASDPEATSVSRMLEAAVRGGGEHHHFRVLQLPMNLLEPGALLERNTGKDVTLTALEAARAAGVAVLVNRPLNAIADGGMQRLADPVPADAPATGRPELVARLRELEEEFRRDVAPAIAVPPGATSPARYFAWADQLAELEEALTGLPHWEHVAGSVVYPQVGHVVGVLDARLQGAAGERWSALRPRYLVALEELLGSLRALAVERSAREAGELAAAVDPLLPEASRALPLSRKSLQALLATPGVTAVLLGMRQVPYVDDALATLALPATAPAGPAIYEAAAAIQGKRGDA